MAINRVHAKIGIGRHRPTKLLQSSRRSDVGLVPISKASKIANGFLFWYLTGSLIWIVGSDALMSALANGAPIPAWANSVKGAAYVLLFGLALRRAARQYLEGVEKAHTTQIEGKLELVKRLAMAAEYRDDQTGNHNYRIGRYTAILGKQLGFDEKACETLAYAATLHDIGKIGIPDALLLKEGPLTDAERQQMERHAVLGADMLAGGTHPLMVMAHAIALCHHERWDGTGYPQGLSGEAIPVEARIVAVCDVFDALTSQRSYKEAWFVQDAITEVVRLRGSHFDPAVVDAFIACLPEIQQIRVQEDLGEIPTYRSNMVPRSILEVPKLRQRKSKPAPAKLTS